MANPEPSQPDGHPIALHEGSITVEVIHCPDRSHVDREKLVLPTGSTVADALRRSAVPARHPELEPIAERAGVGIHGRVVSLATGLCDGDRVELYRPLVIEPMEARRARQLAQKQARPPRRNSPSAA